MGTTASRRRARRLALQALYEWDAVGHPPAAVLEGLARGEGEELDAETAPLVHRLIELVQAHRERLDRLIQAHAPAWPVQQLPGVDRTILRIGLCEMLWELVPAKVAINEAVELAKRFGGEGSPRFVNGVLGSALAELPVAHYSAEDAPLGRR